MGIPTLFATTLQRPLSFYDAHARVQSECRAVVHKYLKNAPWQRLNCTGHARNNRRFQQFATIKKDYP